MTAATVPNSRDAIPRWRDLSATIANGELGSAQHEPELDVVARNELNKSRIAWERDPSQVMTAELVSTGLVLGVPSEVQDAVDALLGQQLAPVMSRLAQEAKIGAVKIGSEEGVPDLPNDDIALHLAIAGLKQRIFKEPRRALAWLEMARLYAQLGQIEVAQRSVEVALSLAPESRYVLRSAVAFFANVNEMERAHVILLAATRTREDPWLISAELATAEKSGRRSLNAKRGTKLMSDGRFSARDISELGVELATIELRNGSSKSARRLLVPAMVSPTENAVAQAEVMSVMSKSITAPVDTMNMSTAFEARARKELEEGQWAEAERSSSSWLADQPFSSEAALFASYTVMSGLRDFSLSLEYAERGLKANPFDTGLLNNAAVAQLESGDLLGARERLDKAAQFSAARHTRIALLATRGMLEFRSGHPDVGRRYYLDAISLAKTESSPRQRALASVMLAREEILSRTSHIADAVQTAERLTRGTDSKVVASWMTSIAEEYASLEEERL